MSKLGATASINFAKSKIKWSSLSAHNHRNYFDMKHDKNKHIDPNLSKYNSYGTLLNYFKFMSKFVDKSKLAKQRKKYLKRRQKSRARKYASPKAFLQSKNHRNCRCGIITLGDHKFRKELENKIKKQIPVMSKKSILLTEKAVLHDYIINFNNRHRYIKIISYAEHLDEQFLHAHAEFMGIPGRTKHGKLQLNFNKSLRLEMATKKERKAFQKDHEYKHLPNNKVALHRFQSQEDHLIIGSALHKNFNVNLVRKGASKDDQKQHSLAVSESAKASSYASLAISSSSYLNSLNVDYRASISKSAEDSVKAKKKELASSAQSLATAKNNFDSSAYGGYASQLSNAITPILSKSEPNRYWMPMAKGTRPCTHNGKPLLNPLAYLASSQASRASSASSAYNLTRDKNKSLDDENSDLSDRNSSLTSSNNDLSNRNDDLNNQISTHKSLLGRLKDTAHNIIQSAKDTAKSIISSAKQKVMMWKGVNNNGLDAMEDFIRENNSKAVTNPTQSDKDNGRYDPSDLYGSEFLSAYNDTANQVHDRKVRQRQRQNQNGFTWGE